MILLLLPTAPIIKDPSQGVRCISVCVFYLAFGCICMKKYTVKVFLPIIRFALSNCDPRCGSFLEPLPSFLVLVLVIAVVVRGTDFPIRLIDIHVQCLMDLTNRLTIVNYAFIKLNLLYPAEILYVLGLLNAYMSTLICLLL